MKKALLALIAGAMVVVSCTEQTDPNKLHLTGSLEGMGDTLIASVIQTDGNAPVNDTIVVAGGKIDALISLDQVATVLLTKLSDPEGSSVVITGVPGETCELSGTWDEYTMNGSQFYADYNKMNQAIEPAIKDLRTLLDKCMDMIENGKDEAEVSALYQKESPALMEAANKAMIDFIRQNPKNEACATLISNFDGEEQKEALNALDESVKKGRMSVILQPIIEQIERMESVSEGKEAPDFSLKDLNGKTLSLKNFRGKYLILDFWGSWCGWCIKGFPEMKEYYAKYKNQFEILGIDCGDEEDAWKAAVAENQLPWKHVYNPKESELTDDYAIQGYPTKIVIDPDGNIAKVFIGEDPAFYEYLDQLFGESK